MPAGYASYAEVVAGLHERFSTIAALTAILDYEPKAVQTSPLLYSLIDEVTRTQTGQITAMRYRILHRLVIQWQDNEQAEQQLLPFVNAIPASVDADATLGGRIHMGLARIADAKSGFMSIGGTQYRVLDFFSDVLTKGAYQSGI